MTAEQRLADRRERLMSAAYTLYAKPGFAATTIERLCTEARISNRAFYECFGGREELLRALHERCVEETLVELTKALQDSHGPLIERINTGISTYVMFATADWRRARIMHLEVRRSGDVLTVARQQAIGAFAQLIDEAWAEEPMPAPVSRRLLTLGVIGALQELLIEWVLAEEQPPVEELVATAVHIFSRSFTAVS